MHKNTLTAIVVCCLTIIVVVVLALVLTRPTELKTCKDGRTVPIDEPCPRGSNR
jgi:hypothetical protein